MVSDATDAEGDAPMAATSAQRSSNLAMSAEFVRNMAMAGNMAMSAVTAVPNVLGIEPERHVEFNWHVIDDVARADVAHKDVEYTDMELAGVEHFLLEQPRRPYAALVSAEVVGATLSAERN